MIPPAFTTLFGAATSAIGFLIAAPGVTSRASRPEVSIQSALKILTSSPLPSQLIGGSAFADGDMEKARFYFNQSIAITEKRIAADPANLVWLSHFSRGYNMLGKISEVEKKYDQALYWYGLDLKTLLKYSKTQPSNEGIQISLANCNYRIADIEWLTGKPDRACDAYNEGLRIFGILYAAMHENPAVMAGVGFGNERLGSIALSQKRIAEASVFQAAGVGIREKICLRAPNDWEARRNLACSFDLLAQVLMEKMEFENARVNCERAVFIRTVLVAKLPNDESLKKRLKSSYELLGDVVVRQHGTLRAIEHYAKSITITEILAASKPNDAEILRSLYRLHGKIGKVHITLGDKVSIERDLKAMRSVILYMKGRGIPLAPNELVFLQQSEKANPKN